MKNRFVGSMRVGVPKRGRPLGSIVVSNSVNDPLAPGAITDFAWTTTATDNEPDFDLNLPSGSAVAAQDAAADDHLIIEYQDSGGGAWTEYLDYTLVAQDIIDDTISVTSVSTVSDGTYNFRARLERGVHIGPNTAGVAVTIDTTAPTLSSATGTATGETTASLSVSTNEGNGTLYWVVDQSATPPSAAQVKAGQDNGGVAADDAGSQAVSTTGVQAISGGATGLTAGTGYNTYFMHEDQYGNQSSVSAAAAFTTQGGAFSPADFGADLMLWLEADDLTTLWQNVAGSSQVSASTQTVGKWDDKSGAGFDLTAAADDTTRPTYNESGGLHWVNFDGSNDLLRRLASLGMYAAGAVSVYAAIRGNPSANTIFLGGGSSTDNDPITAYLACSATTAANHCALLRNDAATVMLTNNDLVILNTSGWDNTDNVIGVEDSGTACIGYLDGVAGTSRAYTRSGSVTVDRFAIGGLQRGSPSSHFAARLYALVVVDRELTAGERGDLVTYLGAKMGRSL